MLHGNDGKRTSLSPFDFRFISLFAASTEIVKVERFCFIENESQIETTRILRANCQFLSKFQLKVDSRIENIKTLKMWPQLISITMHKSTNAIYIGMYADADDDEKDDSLTQTEMQL